MIKKGVKYMLKEIYLAGGCFWGVEAFFNRMIGVEYTDVGYANGSTSQTNYELVDSTEIMQKQFMWCMTRAKSN